MKEKEAKMKDLFEVITDDELGEATGGAKPDSNIIGEAGSTLCGKPKGLGQFVKSVKNEKDK